MMIQGNSHTNLWAAKQGQDRGSAADSSLNCSNKCHIPDLEHCALGVKYAVKSEEENKNLKYIYM